ncbi:hypothetical protein AB3N02_21890 [Priestia aryabhattai]|uniref:hypothetical protein n=1 Tax=Priestia aryabhattai TaxID=412384 RepID=UPI00399FA67B
MVTDTTFRLDHFINTLGLPRGLADGLLVTEQDCNEFYIGFYKRNRYVADDLLDYREHKIYSSDMTLQKFIDLCHTSQIKDVFEMTFLQVFTDIDMIMINEAIKSRQVTLKALYESSRKNPFENILKYIL